MIERLFFADGMGRSFRGRKVLSAASMWASPGRISVLLGRNGTGKTTLIRCALGLVEPEYGTVHFAGTAYTRPRLFRLARAGLFFLPTERLLSRRLTLRSQLDMVAGMRDRSGALGQSSPRDEVAELLRLDGLLARSPHSFSGGEMRRAEVALALFRRPLCLIADEPFHGVDPVDVETVSAALRRLADAGCAMILTGHEVGPLLDLADDVTWLTTGGSTHGLGTPEQARTHHLFRQEYLGDR